MCQKQKKQNLHIHAKHGVKIVFVIVLSAVFELKGYEPLTTVNMSLEGKLKQRLCSEKSRSGIKYIYFFTKNRLLVKTGATQ